jgi:hypothetical protein
MGVADNREFQFIIHSSLPLLLAFMNSIKPDIIGTQEMNSIWLKKLKSTMPDYENYGVKRGGDSEEKNSEMNAVFWNKTKFSAVEKNTEYCRHSKQICPVAQYGG